MFPNPYFDPAEPSSGFLIAFPPYVVNGYPSWSWDPTSTLKLNLATTQGGAILSSGAGTYAVRGAATQPGVGTAPPAGACSGSIEGSYYVAERWGVVANFNELAVDYAVQDGSPIVGLVFNYRVRGGSGSQAY